MIRFRKPPLRITALLAIAVRPWLWTHALRFRRPGFHLMPDRAYMEFRNETAFGDKHHRPDAVETIQYLRWCRGMHRLRNYA